MLSPSPQEWLARYASHGDEAAFSSLVRTQSPLVWRTAMRRLGDAQLAEEAVQNVFLALARKSARLASRPGLSAWLHRAAVLEASALARSRSRREKRHFHWSLNLARADLTSAGETESATASHFPAPASVAADSPVGLLLDEALNRLPETDRALLLGRYFEERGYEELGAALGKTGAAVKKRTQRALEKVATHLRRRGVVLSAGGLKSLAAAEFSPAAALCPTPTLFSLPVSSALPAGSPFAFWSQRLFFLMSTSKMTLTAAALLLLLLGVSDWQAGANADLRQEILGRRAALEKRAEAEAAARARTSAAHSTKPPAAAPAARPLPDPIDGMTLVRLYAHFRSLVGDDLLFEPVPPNWPEDMARHYQQADTAEILRLLDEAGKAPVPEALRRKITEELITTPLFEHHPLLALRLALEKGIASEDLTRLMRQFAAKDLNAAEKLFGEVSSPGSGGEYAAGELMAGFGEFFAEKADPLQWREFPPALSAFADRHLDSGLISFLIFGSADDPQGSFFNTLMVAPGPALDLAGRVTDATDRDRIFCGMARLFMMLQPDRIAPKADAGTYFEKGELRMPTGPNPDHPEITSIVIPNVLDDPRFPAALRDYAIQEGVEYRGGAWSALVSVSDLSAPASRDENLARAAERLASTRRQDFDKAPEPASTEGRRILDQTLADTARALAARENPDLARTLAEKISNPQLRSQTLRTATP